MKEPDQHSSPIKSPKQLIIVVVLAFVVPIVVIVLVTQLVTSGRYGSSESDKDVLARIQAVGHVVIGEAGPAKGTLAGDAVYGQVCKTCHEAGLAGAPKMGDKGAWGPRIAQGQSTVEQHAVAGFQGKTGVMPPKGGNADLSDNEVARAVVFMANQAGASGEEPAAPAAPPSTTAAAAPATAPPSAAPTQPGGPAHGKTIYESTSVACHGAGIGDIQGCHAEFCQLLDLIGFSKSSDRLWLVGDLVNRGPESLEVLREVTALDDAAGTVLGDHDFHLLTIAEGHRRPHRGDTLD